MMHSRGRGRRHRGGCANSSRYKRKRKQGHEPELRSGYKRSGGQRYALVLGYVGTDFYGMQRQLRDGAEVLSTIEGDLIEALNHLEVPSVGGIPLGWSRAARTDRGVHAVMQVVACNITFKCVKDEIVEPHIVEEYVTKMKRNSCNNVTRSEMLDNPLFDDLPRDHENKSHNTPHADDGLHGDTHNPLLADDSPGESAEAKIERILNLQASDEITFLRALKSRLPSSINVFGMRRVSKNFDARLLCGRRTYEYVLPSGVLKRSDVGAEHKSDYRYERLRLSLDDWFAGHPQKEKINILEPRNSNAPWRASSSTGNAAGDSSSALEGEVSKGTTNSSPPGGLVLGEHTLDEPLEKTIERLNTLFKQYLGCHSFHNFTSGKQSSDPTVKRYIEDITVAPISEPHTGYLVVSVTGQSFLPHQIRKMIGLVIEIVRGSAPADAIAECLRTDVKRYLHLAPGDGLLLNRVLYYPYNCSNRASPPLVPLLDFSDYDDEIGEFKHNHVYTAVIKAFQDGVWNKWTDEVSRYPFIEANYDLN